LIALNIAGDYTNNQIIKSLSPSKQYKETFGAVSTFTFFASIYTSSQVSELEKAVQEYIKRSEQQNK
jgi:hypothetical protein